MKNEKTLAIKSSLIVAQHTKFQQHLALNDAMLYACPLEISLSFVAMKLENKDLGWWRAT